MLSYRTLSWADLLERMRHQPRDEPAWSEAQARLERFARLASRRDYAGADWAAEVAGRVLLKLHRDPELLTRLSQPDATERPQNYVIAMVCSAAADLGREEERYYRKLVFGRDMLDASATQIPPDEAAAARDLAARLKDELERRLTSAELALVRSRFWQDRSIQEIADQEGVAYHTIAMRISRLQKKLLELFKDRFGP